MCVREGGESPGYTVSMSDVVGLRRVPCHLQIPRGRGVGGRCGVCVRLLVGGWCGV